MKDCTGKPMIDELKIEEAREIINSKLGIPVRLAIKEVHKSTLIVKEGVITATYDNIFTVNQKVNKFYSEEKSYTYRDFLTKRIQIL